MAWLAVSSGLRARTTNVSLSLCWRWSNADRSTVDLRWLSSIPRITGIARTSWLSLEDLLRSPGTRRLYRIVRAFRSTQKPCLSKGLIFSRCESVDRVLASPCCLKSRSCPSSPLAVELGLLKNECGKVSGFVVHLTVNLNVSFLHALTFKNNTFNWSSFYIFLVVLDYVI